jgi:hypothetical protein
MAHTAGVTMKTARKSSGKGRKKNRCEYHVYDGRTYLGRFLLDEKTRKAKAFDIAGKSIGEFIGFNAAAAAVGQHVPSQKRIRQPENMEETDRRASNR